MKTTTRRPPEPSPVRAEIGAHVKARLDANPRLKRANIPNADIYFGADFIPQATCDLMIARIDAGSRKSTLLSDSADPYFRTSDSCDLDRWAPDIQPVDEAIADLLGIHPNYGETIQGQRYAPGQQFRAHHDFFHSTESYWADMQKSGGQRTWTAMIFLNDVEEGGATWFPLAGVKFRPKRGFLLAWNNMLADGSPNYDTLHEGMAVTQGTKYIITKWFREGPWIR
ncbi:prolyl hydroxylase family protein [Sphingomonas sp. FW199]|uniref:prolyl hydroxylase family protein n=1 Tax=Sphingomonas sp. FW199 TaxID=3400217 RepID=UPI003CE7E006